MLLIVYQAHAGSNPVYVAKHSKGLIYQTFFLLKKEVSSAMGNL